MVEQNQHICFCDAADGTRIAVASLGTGPPIVRAAHWLSHVEYDLRSPVWRPWLLEISRTHTYIRYDQRGCGLSDWETRTLDLKSLVGDLEAVVDGLAFPKFVLFGMSQGGAIAISYAVRHPERVSHLVLLGAYARGLLHRDLTPEQKVEADILVDLVRIGWGRDNPAFRQVFTSQFIPDGTAEQYRWWNDLERMTASPENAARSLQVFHNIDVTDLLAQIRVPTLVMHARGDARCPFEEGRLLASMIPGARFVVLESNNHVLLENEPAWGHFLSDLRAFIGEPEYVDRVLSGPLGELSASEFDVLELIARGLDNKTIAMKLEKTEKTVRNQISSIFSKLQVRTRAEVIVLAHDNGVGIGTR